MKSTSHFVANGGWVTRQTMGRPQARFFGSLSLICSIISICASFPFLDNWPESFGYLEWLCALLLVPQVVFVVIALVFFVREEPRMIVEQHPNPDYDIRKLY